MMTHAVLLVLENRCELRPGGADLEVSALELQEWVESAVRMLLVDSVIEQVGQLVKGKSRFPKRETKPRARGLLV